MKVSPGYSDKFLPKNVWKMRKIEEQFKYLYESTHFRTVSSAITSEEFSAFLQEHADDDLFRDAIDPEEYQSSLMEDDYFQTQLDVSAIENIRYMPAVIHQHQFFEIACVLSGNVQNFMDQKVMDLNAGDILIMPPGTRHGICTYQDDGILINILVRSTTFEQNFLNLIPDDDLLYSFFANALQPAKSSKSTPYLLFRTGDDTILRRNVLDITREYSRNMRYRNTMLNSMLSIFFVNLMRYHEEQVESPEMGTSALSRDTILIIQYMQKNYSTITLKHLAEFFNYSERQMQRIILAATGCTFSENLLRLRMSHAAALLTQTDHSVSDIAGVLGYYDTSSFRHAFRAYYHETPQLYRSEHRDEDPSEPAGT